MNDTIIFLPSQNKQIDFEFIEQFESESSEKRGAQQLEQNQMTLFDIRQDAILEELASCDPDSMTPMEALQLIYRLRSESRKVLDF